MMGKFNAKCLLILIIFVVIITPKQSFVFGSTHTSIRPEQLFRDANNASPSTPLAPLPPAPAMAPAPSLIPVPQMWQLPQQLPQQLPPPQQSPVFINKVAGATLQQNYDAIYNSDSKTINLIATRILDFAFELETQLAKAPVPTKNEVFSPVSLISALTLLMLGARGNSYLQLRKLIGLDLDAEFLIQPSKFHIEFGHLIEQLQRDIVDVSKNSLPTDPKSSQNPIEIIKVSNGLFVQNGYNLNPNYRYVASSVYRSEVIPLDFQTKSAEAKDFINAWTNEKTFGKIPTVISDQIPQTTNAILINTLYFKGLWENSFFEPATVQDNFFPNGYQDAPVIKTMMATGGNFKYFHSPEYGCRIIAMPYKGGTTTMYVLQPDNSTRSRLLEFQSQMNAQKINELISKMDYRSAVIIFPKMRLLHTLKLKSILSNLGVVDIFHNTLSDLSLIGGVPGPQFLNKISHQATEPIKFHDRFVFNRFGEVINEAKNTTSTAGGTKKRKRQAPAPTSRLSFKSNSLDNLEAQRHNEQIIRSDLFVEDILQKVNFDVNESGTEAAAATFTSLRRSGPDVYFRTDTPFLLFIRHEPTNLTLFYGRINEPES